MFSWTFKVEWLRFYHDFSALHANSSETIEQEGIRNLALFTCDCWPGRYSVLGFMFSCNVWRLKAFDTFALAKHTHLSAYVEHSVSVNAFQLLTSPTVYS